MADEDRYTRITLRIPKELTSLLKAAADASSHSMNAEIVQRLEESFPDDSAQLSQEDIDDALLDSAEMYIIMADDEAVMRLLGKRFTYRRR